MNIIIAIKNVIIETTNKKISPETLDKDLLLRATETDFTDNCYIIDNTNVFIIHFLNGYKSEAFKLTVIGERIICSNCNIKIIDFGSFYELVYVSNYIILKHIVKFNNLTINAVFYKENSQFYYKVSLGKTFEIIETDYLQNPKLYSITACGCPIIVLEGNCDEKKVLSIAFVSNNEIIFNTVIADAFTINSNRITETTCFNDMLQSKRTTYFTLTPKGLSIADRSFVYNENVTYSPMLNPCLFLEALYRKDYDFAKNLCSDSFKTVLSKIQKSILPFDNFYVKSYNEIAIIFNDDITWLSFETQENLICNIKIKE